MFPLRKSFEKQTKTFEEQGEKQIRTIEDQREKQKMHLKIESKKIFLDRLKFNCFFVFKKYYLIDEAEYKLKNCKKWKINSIGII